MSKNIAVIGSYAVGMTITGDHFPLPGQTVPGRNFIKAHGGKGSNQAVAAARMGGHVIYGTCVGNDEFGDGAIKLFQEEGMDAEAVRRSATGKSTGVGLIYLNKEGENTIIIDFAASEEFSREDVDSMLPKLKNCEMLLMQLEGSMDTVEYAASLCKKEGIPFILNPAPFSPLKEELLKNCSYITPNQTEARAILGLEADDPISDADVAARLYDMGIENVIVTLGADGAYIKNKDLDQKVGGIKVSPVDTTGAGDTFAGAFCVALTEGKSIVDAVFFANVAAGLAVTKYGVIESIPDRAEVDELVKKNSPN